MNLVYAAGLQIPDIDPIVHWTQGASVRIGQIPDIDPIVHWTQGEVSGSVGPKSQEIVRGVVLPLPRC